MKDDPIFQQEGADIKAAMNIFLDAHLNEVLCHFTIDTSTSMDFQNAAIALS